MLLLLLLFMTPCLAFGDITVATAQYVQESVATRVDTSATANQTMEGNYTVSGTLVVPTPPLPTAE